MSVTILHSKWTVAAVGHTTENMTAANNSSSCLDLDPVDPVWLTKHVCKYEYRSIEIRKQDSHSKAPVNTHGCLLGCCAFIDGMGLSVKWGERVGKTCSNGPGRESHWLLDGTFCYWLYWDDTLFSVCFVFPPEYFLIHPFTQNLTPASSSMEKVCTLESSCTCGGCVQSWPPIWTIQFCSSAWLKPVCIFLLFCDQWPLSTRYWWVVL